MNSRQRKTMERLFRTPVSKNLAWRQVASLLTALGFDLEERSGSRVAVIQSGHVHVVHVPHPVPHMKPYAIRELVKFLKERGYESPDVS